MSHASDSGLSATEVYPGPSLLEQLGADSLRLAAACLNLAYGPMAWAIAFSAIRRHLLDSDGVRAGLWGGAIVWLFSSLGALAVSVGRHRRFRDRVLESPVASLPVCPRLCRRFAGLRWFAVANLVAAPLLGLAVIGIGGWEMIRSAIGGGLFIMAITWLPASWAWAAIALEDRRAAADLCHCEKRSFARLSMISSRPLS